MSDEHKTEPILIAAAWILVCVPAAWGIYNTVINARKLFAETNLQPKPTVPKTLPGRFK